MLKWAFISYFNTSVARHFHGLRAQVSTAALSKWSVNDTLLCQLPNSLPMHGRNKTSKHDEAPSDRAPQARVVAPRWECRRRDNRGAKGAE